MAGLLVLKPGSDWTATGGPFDWTLEFLMHRVSDKNVVEQMREIVDNNLGSLWLSEFPVETQREIVAALRDDLVATAERDLPDTAYKAPAIGQLQQLASLAESLDI